jgi:hypothetical protein
VDEQRRSGALRRAAREALEHETIESLERDLRQVLAILDGTAVEP